MTEKPEPRKLSYSGELLPIVLLEEALEKYYVSALHAKELERYPWWTPEKIAGRTRELQMKDWSSCSIRSFPIEKVDEPFPVENAKYGYGEGPLDPTTTRICARQRVEVFVSHGTGSSVLVCTLMQYLPSYWAHSPQGWADNWVWHRWLPEKVILVLRGYRQNDKYVRFPITYSSEERIKNHDGWYAYLGEPTEGVFEDLEVDKSDEDAEIATS